MKRILPFMALVLMLCSSCGKTIYDEAEEDKPVDNIKSNLVISVTPKGLNPIDTRGDGVSLDDYFATINFVVYQKGAKVKAITQKSSDGTYGTAGFTLNAGTYQLLVLAHSSSSNPSLADPTKLKFTNEDGFSDTFYYYGDVTVTNEKQVVSIELERCTSLLQFVVTDTIPANVSRIWFRMTGGSGTLDATTGYGCVNSTQVVNAQISPDQKPPYTFDLYTILKGNEADVTLMVKPFDATDNITDGRFDEFSRDIHLVRGRITVFKGRFFTDPTDPGTGSGGGTGGSTGGGSGDEGESDVSFNVSFDPSWGEPFEFEF